MTMEVMSKKLVVWRLADLLFMVGVGLLILVMGLGVLMVMLRVEPSGSAEVPPLTLAFVIGATAVQILAFVVPVYLIGWWRRVAWAEAVGWRLTTRYWLKVATCLGLLCIPLTGLIATGVQMLLGEEGNPQLEFIAPEGFSWLGLVAMTVLIGFFVPLAEELVFRGVFLVWLRQILGAGWAIFLSALLFALFHGELAIIAGTFPLGLACGWVAYKSGSVWPAVLIHVINNAVKIPIIYYLLL